MATRTPAATFIPYAGATLPNGAVIVESRPEQRGQGSVVLAIASPGTVWAEYVVWRMDPSTGLCHLGDYYRVDRFAEALAGYHAR